MATVSFNELFEKDASGSFKNKVAIDIPGFMRCGPGGNFKDNKVNGVDPIASIEGKQVNVEISETNGVKVYKILGAA